MFVKVTNGEAVEYTIGQLRRDNPKTSFPRQIPNELLANFDVYPLYVEDTPIYDTLYQKIEEGAIEQNEIGNWVKRRTLVDLPEETIAENIRKKRNELLAEVDLDIAILAEINFYDPTKLRLDVKFVNLRNYKQALRDLPEQEGFPLNVEWPTKPE